VVYMAHVSEKENVYRVVILKPKGDRLLGTH
jgi:hypothetical protein